ncbi:MAG: hypothetical protein IJ856_07235 [Candidatus Methanomethylophilaceae archaeon]|nr:hypothetical protein [Candidatus Methanomethylophilaceae archaeon]
MGNTTTWEWVESCIVGRGTMGLMVQAGEFAERMSEIFRDSDPLSGMERRFYPDEPYEFVFRWTEGDRKVEVTFMADPDLSGWSVVDGRRRSRGRIPPGDDGALRPLTKALESL